MDIFKQKYWFEKDNIDPHAKIFSSVDSILDSTHGNQRLEDFSLYARLYGKYLLLSFGERYMNPNPVSSLLTYNVIKSCVDTLTSKITQQTPSVMFLTDGEDFYKQEKAKLATKFVSACMYATNFDVEAKKSFLDGSLFGLGVLKIVADKGSDKLIVERTLPFELMIDEYDAMYGTQKNMFQRKVINKDSLKAAFPKFAAEISNAKNAGESVYQRLYEQTWVIEAWHLPSGDDPKAKGYVAGRHVICIDGATLVDEEWNKNYFPFVFFHFTDPLVGFWPTGLGEMLIGLQLEINKTIKVIRRIMEYSVPKLIIPTGCSIATQQLSNYVMDVIKIVGGGKPEVMQLASANPQLFQYLANLYQKAFEIAGISELSSQAKKPAGLNSGRAIRNFYQIESERYAVTEQKWEKMYVDAARMMISESRELSKDFKVTDISKDGISKLSWLDIELDDEDYKIQAFPISALPKTPAGRLDSITELIAGGYLTREQGLELLNFPDISRVTDLDLSPRKLIRKMVDAIVLKNEYTAPEKFDDLVYGIEYAQKSYALGKLNKIPEERLNNLIKWLTDCSALMDQINAPQAPMPGMPGQPQIPGMPGQTQIPGMPELPPETYEPQGRPQRPPISDLIPMKGISTVAGAPEAPQGGSEQPL